MKITHTILASFAFFCATELSSSELQTLTNPAIRDFFTCGEKFNRRFYWGGLQIPVSQGLSDFGKEQEALFSAYIQLDLDKTEQQYNNLTETLNGTVIDTDLFRYLCKEYASAPTAEERIKYAEPTDAPTSFLADYMFYKKLHDLVHKSEPEHSQLSVVIMAGGYGSGKTTAVPALKLPAISRANLIRDRSMDEDFKVPEAMIAEALKYNVKVTVIYVFRPIEQAFRSVIKRARSDGRISPIIQTAIAHWQAQDNVLKLHETFGNKITITVIDNSRQPSDPVIVSDPIAFLESKEIRYPSQQDAIDRILTEFNAVNKTEIPTGVLAVLERDLTIVQQDRKTLEAENKSWNKILRSFIGSWFFSDETI